MQQVQRVSQVAVVSAKDLSGSPLTMSALTLNQRSPTLEHAKRYLDELSLAYIVKAMCSENYPLPSWTEQEARHCEKLYKNFLLLFKYYPNENLVPTRQIDEFWHNHILYTKQYHHDCQHIFGHYLHHQPAEPFDDTAILVDHFIKTQQLYFACFQHSMIDFTINTQGPG